MNNLKMDSSLIEKFDIIYDSLINGQKKQAVFQMKELSPIEISELLDYFHYDLTKPQLALELSKAYINS